MKYKVNRALIVDDNVALARVTQFAMKGAGFETETAYNGDDALQAAQESQFDVIITDQQMPKLNGLELCAELRALPQYADVPIILLTAKGLELELSKYTEHLGVDATFAKPFSPTAIVKAAEELLAAKVQSEVCI